MQKSIRALSNVELNSQLKNLARSERKVTALVVEHIAEVDRRKLYLDLGYGSLFEYLIKALGYSESAAYRRLQAARALIVVPEMKSALEDGSLKLSQVAAAQTALRNEERIRGEKVSAAARREIFEKLKNCDGKQTQKILDQHLTPLPPRPVEKLKADESVELNLILPKEVFEELKRVKEIYSHICPSGEWVEILKLMAKDVLKKRDPLAKTIAKTIAEITAETEAETTAKKMVRTTVKTMAQKVTQSLTVAEVKSGRQPIPQNVRASVFQRDHGRCQHKTENGKMCGSKFQLEIDHIKPIFLGGGNGVENLRVLCRQHNRHRYEQRD